MSLMRLLVRAGSKGLEMSGACARRCTGVCGGAAPPEGVLVAADVEGVRCGGGGGPWQAEEPVGGVEEGS